MEKVLIVGASPNEDRYSFKAMNLLSSHGHEVVLFNPRYERILEFEVYTDLAFINFQVDTITMYVNDSISQSMLDDFLKIAPKRVIFNPGSESEFLESELSKNGISVERACTLVLVNTGQF